MGNDVNSCEAQTCTYKYPETRTVIQAEKEEKIISNLFYCVFCHFGQVNYTQN